MSFSPTEYLQHILDEANYLVGHSRAVTKEAFLKNETLKRAFVRSLEVIGEAVKKLPEAMRQRHPQVEWRLLAGMRDRLIHGYFSVDYELVWDVVTRKIPELQREVERILVDEAGGTA